MTPPIARVGHAIYSDPIPIWDRKSGKLTDFTTHYTFMIDTQGESERYGHGLAFFFAPVGFQIPPNSGGGYLGLFNTTNYVELSQNQMIVIEFDSFWNYELDPQDISVGHVGIDKNSIRSANNTPWNASLHSRDVWVAYNATTQILNM